MYMYTVILYTVSPVYMYLSLAATQFLQTFYQRSFLIKQESLVGARGRTELSSKLSYSYTGLKTKYFTTRCLSLMSALPFANLQPVFFPA